MVWFLVKRPSEMHFITLWSKFNQDFAKLLSESTLDMPPPKAWEIYFTREWENAFASKPLYFPYFVSLILNYVAYPFGRPEDIAKKGPENDDEILDELLNHDEDIYADINLDGN